VIDVPTREPHAAQGRGRRAPALRRAPWWFVALAAVLLFGAGLRFYNLNWDDGAHLHPDEREITMVAQALHWPRPGDSAGAAARGGHGPLDPHFFAYGSLPLYLLAAAGNVAHRAGLLLAAHGAGAPSTVALLVSGDQYGGMNLVGRFLSALFDTASILLCFLLGRRVYNLAAGVIAAAGYAVTALAVQQSHYYVVDPILTFFVLATLLFCGRSLQEGRKSDALLTGILFGCAMATKVSAAPLGLAVLLAQAAPAWQARRLKDVARRQALLSSRLDGLLLAAVGAVAAFLICEPYALLDWTQFRRDLTEQSAMVRGVADLPYTRQYAPTVPYLYWLQGLLTWQMTPLLAATGLAGLCWQGWRAVRRHGHAELLLVSWWLPYLLLTGAFYAKFPRYLLPAIPLLCIAAAGGGVTLAAQGDIRRRVAYGFTALTLATAAFYCLAYEHIYATTNTRVAASDWIYQQIPAVTNGQQTVLTHEVWDDGLPLDRGSVNAAWTPGRYAYVDLPIYDDDTVQKQQTLIRDLQRADYVVEASEIVRGSILRNPQRYPMTTAYYRALADGQLGYQRVERFRSVPQLFGLRFDDRSSDLNWQFYDHPPVTIYRKVRPVPAATMAALFPAPAGPLAASPPARPSLQLTPQAQAADNTSPAQDQMFPGAGLGMRFPVPVWLLAVEALGLIALPWSVRLLRTLPDAGFSGAKALGILLTGWATWLLASTGVAWNTQRTTLLVLAVLAVAGLASWLTLPGWQALLRQKWRLWLISEVVFLAAFLLFLWVRASNPDLWQLYRGGEKPMELSYINAILRSRALPPYDPWLSGTTINYYYFGFYLIAMLFKLTRIAPTIGFNLAIPLLYGLAVQLAAAVGYAVTGLLLGRGTTAPALPAARSAVLDRRAALGALAAVLMFGVLGNLDSGPYLLGLLQQAGTAAVGGNLPVLGGPLQVLTGLIHTLTGSAALPGFNYFDRTRVIPFTINEFPFFSFLYADMHPHVIDMPFELLAIAFALALVTPGSGLRRLSLGPTALLLGGLLLGALWPINVWDYPTFLLLAVLAMWLRHFRGDNVLAAVKPALAFGLWLLAIGRLAFLPFYRHFYALDSGVGLPAHHSDIAHFLLVYGLFFFIVGTAVVLEQALPLAHLATLLLPVVALAFVSRSPVLALLVGLIALSLRAVWLRRYRRHLLPTFMLLGLALAVILGTELIYIKDPLQGGDWQRMNTVFKFGVQAWLLLAVSCGPLLVWLGGRRSLPLRPAPTPLTAAAEGQGSDREAFAPAGSLTMGPIMALAGAGPTAPAPAAAAVTPSAALETTSRAQAPGPRRRARLLPGWWWGALAVLALSAAVYPVMALPARVTDRWPANAPTPSLDGMAFMRFNYPGDYAAIRWLQQHVAGTPVLLEANKDDYTWYGRVSWFTGLPTLLGWSYHTSQFHDPALIAPRQDAIRTIYTTTDSAVALQLLRQYHVSLIYVGALEREAYGGAKAGAPAALGLAKFDAMVGTSLDLLYNQDGVKIYRVRGGA
jgi:YYY domain-containing protein